MDDRQETKKNSGLYEKSRVYGTKKQKAKLNASSEPVKTKKEFNSNHLGIFVIIIMAIVMLLISVGIAGIFKKPEMKDPTDDTSQSIGDAEAVRHDISGVVLMVDSEGKRLFIHDVISNEEIALKYEGYTKFYGQQGSLIPAGALNSGDLLIFTCNKNKDEEEETVISAKWSDEIWEKSKIDDLLLYPEEHRMVIRGQNYKYTDDLCVIDNGIRSSVSNFLTTADRYTIRGKGTDIYEVIVTIGHGTLNLVNYEDYDGGIVLIGKRYCMDIKDPASYMVREGTYRVEASYGRLSAVEEIEIRRNETAVFDLMPYSKAASYTPTPIPTVAPPTPTPLPEGYAFKTLSIKNIANAEYELDEEHAVYVYGPFKGDLYIDGYYLGTIPCDFEKILGEARLTIIYNSIAYSFDYNGADHDGDVILDYTSDCVE